MVAFDGDRYQLASFVLMPSHVHVLFRPLGTNRLTDIVKSWKGFSVRAINKRMVGVGGALAGGILGSIDSQRAEAAELVAKHYRENVEPLGYEAFLVGVDREACARYKKAIDQFPPPEYSEVVYTGNNNDSPLLKEFHLDPKKERQIRKSFGKLDQRPKILIVTEKLLTGFDAPALYAMYLDKPMRDHTLLQAIARVDRPYENEAQDMVKPHGFVFDFVGIFDKLEKALAFDSDEINAIGKDLRLLKMLFKNTMEAFERRGNFPVSLGRKDGGRNAPAPFNFDDKDVDTLIEHFRNPERREGVLQGIQGKQIDLTLALKNGK